MLDRDFIANGALPLPASIPPPVLSTDGRILRSTPEMAFWSDRIAQRCADTTVLSTIRNKAERIVREAINTEHSPVYRLGLMEELAQEIIELCPAACSDPGCVH